MSLSTTISPTRQTPSLAVAAAVSISSRSTGSLSHAEVRQQCGVDSVGGGVHIRDSNVVISQTLIQENSAQDGSGGGVVRMWLVGQDSSLTIVDSQIISNTSDLSMRGGVGNAVGTGLTATSLIERTLIQWQQRGSGSTMCLRWG
jgi:hypothetical protein